MTDLQKQLIKEVTEAYVFLRENNHTVPSETLHVMLEASKRAILGEEYAQQVKPVSDEEKVNPHNCPYRSGGFCTA